jgi:hypothetical protein
VGISGSHPCSPKYYNSPSQHGLATTTNHLSQQSPSLESRFQTTSIYETPLNNAPIPFFQLQLNFDPQSQWQYTETKEISVNKKDKAIVTPYYRTRAHKKSYRGKKKEYTRTQTSGSYMNNTMGPHNINNNIKFLISNNCCFH